ncbi:hypothetical protein [Actinoplanes sp. NPDC020271]|uniref:hypothetical protein n=1 Tax=Actinoplanes sp. NPDC020271 TaxID=3363896 RepID=UPI0037993ECD
MHHPVPSANRALYTSTARCSVSLPAPALNRLPKPLATIVFHYSPTLTYTPEFASMVDPKTTRNW